MRNDNKFTFFLPCLTCAEYKFDSTNKHRKVNFPLRYCCCLHSSYLRGKLLFFIWSANHASYKFILSLYTFFSTSSSSFAYTQFVTQFFFSRCNKISSDFIASRLNFNEFSKSESDANCETMLISVISCPIIPRVQCHAHVRFSCHSL